MKLLPFLLAVLVLTASPISSQAEVYKWKDKDGTIKYSDTPPPSNIKQEAIKGKRKLGTPTGKAPLAPMENDVVVPAKFNEAPTTPEEAAAKQRRNNADADKRNKQEKEAQAKLNTENCKAAKANLESYAQGGRVYKMNEKGEREYMDDKGLNEGAEKARGEIAEYCK